MKNINNELFLNKINQRIKDGDFDTYFTIPFMTKDLLKISIKEKLKKNIETGGTPILSDREIKECLAEIKEIAVYTIAVYLKLGFMIKTETGFEFTKKGLLAIKLSQSL